MTPRPRNAVAVIDGSLACATLVGVAMWSVMTWNLHGSTGLDVDACAAAIRVEAPDVVVIQEVRRHQIAALAEALSMRYSWALKHYPYTRVLWRRAEGMAIMTPHLLDAAGHSEVSERQPMWSWRRRIAQWALIGRTDRSMIMVYNLHLSPHEDPEMRRAEATRVSDIVAGIGDDPQPVVAGDFNDAGDPTIIDALPGIEHVVPSASSPADTPVQLLDHVLLPADVTDVAVTVPAGGPEWAAISDHLPVTVRFSLPSVPSGV